MKDHYQLVKDYLLELNYTIRIDIPEDGVMVIDRESDGIKNLIIGCAAPILIMEQLIYQTSSLDANMFISLLKKNRDMVHGAFVLDETGSKVIFRDTLQIENLDLNELEASLNSLSLLLSEYSTQILEFSKI